MPYDVLIVDDSAAIRKIVQRVLAQAELPINKIFEAGNGKQALEVLENESISLVLSDVNMPEMDGMELLSKIRNRKAWKQLPIVMITTEGSEAKVMEAVQLGATGYLRKPFTADQIKEKLLTISV